MTRATNATTNIHYMPMPVSTWLLNMRQDLKETMSRNPDIEVMSTNVPVSDHTRIEAALMRLDGMLEIVNQALEVASPHGRVACEAIRGMVHERNNLETIRTILKGER